MHVTHGTHSGERGKGDTPGRKEGGGGGVCAGWFSLLHRNKNRLSAQRPSGTTIFLVVEKLLYKLMKMLKKCLTITRKLLLLTNLKV